MTLLKALTLSLLITATALPVLAGSPNRNSQTNELKRDVVENDAAMDDEIKDMADNKSKRRIHTGDNN